MNKSKNKMTLQEKITLAVVLVAALVVLVAAGMAYRDYRHRRSAVETQKVAQQKVIDDTIALAKSKQEAVRQLDINRLVSICNAFLVRYQALTAKEQLLEVRPDCTLHSVQ